MRIQLFISSLLLLFFSACEESFDLKLRSIEFVVIDGFISNQAGFTQVRLTFSSNFNSNAINKPINDAQVYVVSNEREYARLTEVQNSGIYTPEDVNFITDPQISYWIEIDINDKKYASKPVQSLASASYSIIIEEETKIRVNSALNTVSESGYNISTRLLPKETNEILASHFKWEWLGWYIDPSTNEVIFERPTNYVNIIKSDELDDRTNFYIDFQVKSALPNSDYNLVVIQKAMTQDAFNYWTAIKNQIDVSGTFFDGQPETILGNVFSSDSTEIVLGYVLVGDVKVNTRKLN